MFLTGDLDCDGDIGNAAMISILPQGTGLTDRFSDIVGRTTVKLGRKLSLVQPPEVAGKPYRPLMEETVHRLGARRPIFVGDRLDTDIAGAVTVGMDSLFVLSGAHGAAELLAAGDGRRPTGAVARRR